MKKKVTAAVCSALILIMVFCSVKFFYSSPEKEEEKLPVLSEETAEPEEEIKAEDEKKDEPLKPEEKASEPQKEEKTKAAEEPSERHTCTLSVRCDTAVANKDMMEPGKADILPEDGVIYPEKAVNFSEGESVYDVLVREMMNSKIHMESENTPVYKSAYIKGIANIYEYDCGPLSGWMYKVNGEFPNYGCSGYELSDGDRIEWVYTCDLGADVGNENS